MTLGFVVVVTGEPLRTNIILRDAKAAATRQQQRGEQQIGTLRIGPVWPTRGPELTFAPCLAFSPSIIFLIWSAGAVRKHGRNPEYLEINKQFTLDVVAKAAVLKLFPEFMRSVVALGFPNVETAIRKVRGKVEPLIKEYRNHVQDLDTEFKDFDDRKPNQAFGIFTDRLLDVASEEESSPENIARRILTLNFAALHTSSTSFTHALLHLADNPTYAEELRKEAKAVVHTSGWSVDSLKDAQARQFLGRIKPFFFSDGTYLPAGTLVGVGVHYVRDDDHNYDSANEFNPWRFVPEADADETTAPIIRMTKTSPTYLGFGHGKLACPG
ncbi:cytochrome P450, partial [Hymenopellis radicata]